MNTVSVNLTINYGKTRLGFFIRKKVIWLRQQSLLKTIVSFNKKIVLALHIPLILNLEVKPYEINIIKLKCIFYEYRV